MMRGQEEAPIELMIGAVILMFVMILGFYVYNKTCSSQYEQKIDSSMSKLARDIETVYMGAKGTSIVSDIDLSSTGCSSGVRSFRIIKGTDDICNARIGKSSCMVIAVESNDYTVPLTEVINVPNDVSIIYNSTNKGECELNEIDWDTYLDYLEGMRNDGSSTELSGDCEESVWYAVHYYMRIEKTSSDVITLSGF
jgi:hypothetical protein